MISITLTLQRYENLLEIERKYAELRDKQTSGMETRADDWDEAKHARDAQGRFASDATADTLVMKAKTDGGFTYHPTKGTPSNGYIVSSDTKEKRGKVVDLHGKSDDEVKAEVSSYLQKNEGNLGPNEYIGGYIEKDSHGKPVAMHLDISNHVADRAEAIKLGKERNQISVWDVAKGEEIPTGGTGREPGLDSAKEEPAF